MGKSIAEITIADLESRLADAERAMVEALPSSGGIQDGGSPGEASKMSEERREARRIEKEEMRKKVEAMDAVQGVSTDARDVVAEAEA
eukprot:COSAG05_NODE_22615_length_263_cov_1.231707_1_plen_87_part_11